MSLGKNDFERGTKKPERQKTEYKVLIEVKQKKAAITEKLSQIRKETSRKKFLEQRSRINIAIKKRKTHLMTEELISEATKILTAKDNAQAPFAMEEIFRSSARSFKAPVEKRTDHFKKQFHESIPETQGKVSYTQLVILKGGYFMCQQASKQQNYRS